MSQARRCLRRLLLARATVGGKKRRVAQGSDTTKPPVTIRPTPLTGHLNTTGNQETEPRVSPVPSTPEEKKKKWSTRQGDTDNDVIHKHARGSRPPPVRSGRNLHRGQEETCSNKNSMFSGEGRFKIQRDPRNTGPVQPQNIASTHHGRHHNRSTRRRTAMMTTSDRHGGGRQQEQHHSQNDHHTVSHIISRLMLQQYIEMNTRAHALQRRKYTQINSSE